MSLEDCYVTQFYFPDLLTPYPLIFDLKYKPNVNLEGLLSKRFTVICKVLNPVSGSKLNASIINVSPAIDSPHQNLPNDWGQSVLKLANPFVPTLTAEDRSFEWGWVLPAKPKFPP
jgi:hypothetical protein